jgi:hypothetical protein
VVGGLGVTPDRSPPYAGDGAAEANLSTVEYVIILC